MSPAGPVTHLTLSSASAPLIRLFALEAEGQVAWTCPLPQGDQRTVSLILSLIHVRVPASITVYHRALSRLIDQHGRSWTVILHPEKADGRRCGTWLAGRVEAHLFSAQDV
jgi:hypothetical protein